MTERAEKIVIEPAPSLFGDRLNRVAFTFRHGLASHSMFRDLQLAELCRRTLMNPQGKNFALVAGEALPGDTAAIGALANLLGGSRVIRLARLQDIDEDFAGLLSRIVAEADALCGGALGREIGWPSATLILNAPGAVTPFHIDHQSNLLFQIRGRKTAWLFDACDRQVLDEASIERYYNGNTYALSYRPEFRGRGKPFLLAPGDGLHNPPLGPHWVRNGDELSVSLSVNFSLRATEALARIYQVNGYLRRLGVAPAPPGRSPQRDRIKGWPARILAPARPRSLEELVHGGPARLLQPLAVLRRMLRRTVAVD